MNEKRKKKTKTEMSISFEMELYDVFRRPDITGI